MNRLWTGRRALEPGLATPVQVERVLASLRALQPSGEMQERILLHLRQQSSARAGRATIYGFLWQGWAPAAAAASLICVFTGGLMVAHQTPDAPRMQVGRQQTALAPTAILNPGTTGLAVRASAAPGAEGLALASARRKPVAPVPAGRRRGRSTEANSPGKLR
jgi:hypothetical protein